MSKVSVGQEAPDFTLHEVFGDDMVTLSEHRGQPVVLMFVPLAFSGVCTRELCHVGENWDVWGGLGARIYGISIDSPFVNQKWKSDMGVPFPILSDFNRTAAEAYGVLVQDFFGLEGVAKRSVFVVDGAGSVGFAWVSDDPGVLPPFAEIVDAVRRVS